MNMKMKTMRILEGEYYFRLSKTILTFVKCY